MLSGKYFARRNDNGQLAIHRKLQYAVTRDKVVKELLFNMVAPPPHKYDNRCGEKEPVDSIQYL